MLLIGILAAPVCAQWSGLDGKPLPPLEVGAEFVESQEALLAAARSRLAMDPDSLDEWIWVGRRLAYLGRYVEALEHYTLAAQKFPQEPRILRHRGHRFLTTRQLDQAIGDFEQAAEWMALRSDRVEEDGLPNAHGIPTSTLKTNVWYHLGLARYLTRDFSAASVAFRDCMGASTNADMRVAAQYWLYLSLRREGDLSGAQELLRSIPADLELIENTDYQDLLRGFGSKGGPEGLLSERDSLSDATVGYGVGAWHLVEGRLQDASAQFRRVLGGGNWPAFGYLAAEAEMLLLGGETLAP